MSSTASSFLISVPVSHYEEREYIIYVVFSVFLGVEFHIEKHSFPFTEIRMPSSGGDHRRIILEDVLFQLMKEHSLSEGIAINEKLFTCDLYPSMPRYSSILEPLPILFGRTNGSGNYLDLSCEDEIWLGIDVLGFVFFMLTRYEEFINRDLDMHHRFPASSSIALKHHFIDHPVVDEYVEILWFCMRNLWPGLNRRKHTFEMKVTHDVDIPFDNLFKTPYQLLRSCGGDILKRHNLSLVPRRVKSYLKVQLGNLEADINNTFNIILNIAEEHGLKDAFYFIPYNNHLLDGSYDLEHPAIKELMVKIHNRGHEIGYHGSYQTYQDSRRTRMEVAKLKEVCSSLGIEQEKWGGRQHYLRWEVPETWRNYAEAGLDYDTTLSFADHAGFRCGTCHPFPVYDLEQRKILDLWEYPLIVMECSVLDKQYMGLDHEKAFDYISMLKKTCRQYNGTFTLLWHNSRLIDPMEIDLYRSLLKS